MTIENSARAALRAATSEHHERVDRVFSGAALGVRDSYARFLRAQAAALLPVEAALDRDGVAAVVPDWPARQRSDLLRWDLSDLGADPPEPAGDISFDGEAALLGGLYVLEGSRLGGTLLKRAVPPHLPARFLGGVDSGAWRRLLGLLDDRLDDEPARVAAIAAAGDVFRLFEVSGRRYLAGVQ